MHLRWMEDKLQFQEWIPFAQGGGTWADWADVPVVDEPKDSEVWCEHICYPYQRAYYPKPDGFPDSYFCLNEQVMFCPFDGTPRPKPVKTLAEKFEDVACVVEVHHDKEGRNTWEKVIHKARFQEIAEIAEKHFKEKV